MSRPDDDFDNSDQLASTRLVDSVQLAREARNSHLYGSTEQSNNKFDGLVNSSLVTLNDYDQFSLCAWCPKCCRKVETLIEYKIGMVTWVAFGLLLLFGLWCGCCLLPFCLSICKDVQHVCPDCKSVLGLYKRCRK